MNKLSKYLPGPEKLAQETLATLFAVVVAAWLVSRIPAIRDLVRENSPPTPF